MYRTLKLGGFSVFFAAFVLLALAQGDGADAGQAAAPPGASPPAASQSPAATTSYRIPAGTEVQVEFAEDVGSHTSHAGDKFQLRLAEPIMLHGESAVPAGAPGQGEVIDAGPAGFGGRQGKLIVSGRYLELSGRHVRIRGMTLARSGKSHVDLATGAMLVAPLSALLIDGGEITITAGTRATAKLAEDVELSSNSPGQESGQP